MLTPIALIHATVYGMMDRGFGRIVNITSASIKNPIASLELSNGARLGLTGAVTVLARKAAKSNVTINGILPGPFDTDRLRGTSVEDGGGAQGADRPSSTPSARRQCPRAASEPPTSSAPPSLSCAPLTPVTSPRRTC